MMSLTQATSRRAAARGRTFLPNFVAAALTCPYSGASATSRAATFSASPLAYRGSSAQRTLPTPGTAAAALATASHSWPATSTWTSGSMACAAAMALRVAEPRLALSCSARTRTAI